MRDAYSEDYFVRLLGKPVNQLWSEYKAKYAAGHPERKTMYQGSSWILPLESIINLKQAYIIMPYTLAFGMTEFIYRRYAKDDAELNYGKLNAASFSL
ncbi:hypothetical protein RJ639_006984 [Escallonia herrerae]|uniref:Uncharacterized protein n=1 Tax=Escallonia herrerae TaxID=1293975 RepID=A0AA89AWM8_9ASTE|nr:hypothetical protein RJ639_006984 [Escallonia herrerae]